MTDPIRPRRIGPGGPESVGIVDPDRREPVAPYDRREISAATSEARPSAPHGDDAATLPLRKLVAGVFRTRVWIVSLVLLCTLGAVGYALWLPNLYVSHGSFLLKHGGEEVAVAPMGSDEEPLRNASLLGNAPHILTSTELFRRVIARIGIDRIMAPPPPPSDGARSASLFGAARGWLSDAVATLSAKIAPAVAPGPVSMKTAVEVFASRLRVDAPPKSSLLTVQYVCSDPEAAEEVLTVYLEEARKRHMEVYADQTGIEMVEANHDEARQAHAAARAAYAAFLAELEIVDYDAEVSARRSMFESARIAAQELTDRIRGNELKLAELNKRLVDLPPTIEQSETIRAPNPRIAALQEMITRHEHDRNLLEAKLKRETDPAFLKLDRVVASLRDELVRERLSSDVEQTQQRILPNPQVATFRARTAELALELEVDERSLTLAVERRELAQRDHEELTSRRQDHALLAADVDTARTALDNTVAGLGMARAKRMLNSAEVSSLTPLQEPTAAIKEGPNRGKITITGILIGVFLGLGLAFVRTVTDGTVRNADDLEEIGAVPVLASLPRLDRKTMKRHARIRRRGS